MQESTEQTFTVQITAINLQDQPTLVEALKQLLLNKDQQALDLLFSTVTDIT
jgi:hypothetical protein